MEVDKKEAAPEVPVQDQLKNTHTMIFNSIDFEKIVAAAGVLIGPIDFSNKLRIMLDYDPKKHKVKLEYFKSESIEKGEIPMENDKKEIFYNNMDEIAVSYTEMLKKKLEEAKNNSSSDAIKEINENIRLVSHIAGIMLRIKDLKSERKSGMSINNYYTNYED